MENVHVQSRRVRMRVGVYLTLVVVGALLSLALLTGAMMASENGADSATVLWIFTALAYLGLIAVWVVFWHRAWSSIQDGSPRTTPGKAVGFLFIPLYNLYWMFQAYWGFARDFNVYVRERRLAVRPLAESLFRSLAILNALSFIPYVILFASLACFVVQFMAVHRVCTSVTALADAIEDGGSVPVAESP